jgi:hypothetical protein
MVAAVVREEIDAAVLERPVVVLVELVARVHDGRLELHDLDRARRVVQRDGARGDPTREPDEGDALRILVERERQVRDQELRRHVDRRARVDLPVVGEPHVALAARATDHRREPPRRTTSRKRDREVQHRLAIVSVDVAGVLVHARGHQERFPGRLLPHERHCPERGDRPAGDSIHWIDRAPRSRPGISAWATLSAASQQHGPVNVEPRKQEQRAERRAEDGPERFVP